MKKTLFTLLMSVCLFLMGCPLQTESPIKGDAASIPSWLPGQWTLIKDGKVGTTSYQVKADAASRSRISIVTVDEQGKADKENARRGELSLVKGQLFLSVFEKSDDVSDEGYYHYAIGRSSGGDLQLVPLKEHIVTSGTSGEELAAYIAKHADTEYLDKTAIERYRRL